MLERVDGGAADRNFEQLRAGVAGTGAIMLFAIALPDGWVACDGGTLVRLEQRALYALIGTTFGAGDGSTTFNLPTLADPAANLKYGIKL